MKPYRIIATFLDPVAVKRSRQSQRSQTVASLSGTTVRGALAQHYLRHHGAPDNGFQKLFLDESRCRFGPLDPGPHVIPMTANSCKRREGFSIEGNHGVVDQLWLRVAQRLNEEIDIDRVDEWMWCRPQSGDCGAALKPLTGFWNGDAAAAKKAAPPETTVSAHVGIDRATETSAASIFFTVQAIDAYQSTGETTEQTKLTGTILADEENRKLLDDLLKSDDTIYIGNGRTRGYGRAQLELKEAGESERESDSLSRDKLATWSEELLQFIAQAPFSCDGLDAGQDTFFSIGFPNGAILVDRLLRYTLDPCEMVGWLPRIVRPNEQPIFVECDFGQASAVGAVTRHELIRGWNGAHGLPKVDEWGVSRGAVYAYRFRGDVDRLRQELDVLLRDGIGLRRNEGFGVVEVSNAFHQAFCRQR